MFDWFGNYLPVQGEPVTIHSRHADGEEPYYVCISKGSARVGVWGVNGSPRELTLEQARALVVLIMDDEVEDLGEYGWVEGQGWQPGFGRL